MATKATAALVQSTFDFALREINALEMRIVKAEDDADAMLWEQAHQVAEQIDAGLSQRKLAAQWINARTGEAYSKTHVVVTLAVFRGHFNDQPRRRFRDLYNEITNAGNNNGREQHNSGNFEWYTPALIVDAARDVLGAIDLDPASCARANEIVQARHYYTSDDDGLMQTWHGRVWMNPPYAHPLIEQFVDKLLESLEAGTVPAAIAITNNTTDVGWFHALGRMASAICLCTGRVHFWQTNPDVREINGPLQGQAIFYCGSDADRFCARFDELGVVLVKP